MGCRGRIAGAVFIFIADMALLMLVHGPDKLAKSPVDGRRGSFSQELHDLESLFPREGKLDAGCHHGWREFHY